MRPLSPNSRYLVARTVLNDAGQEAFTVPLDRPILRVTGERLYVVTEQDVLRADNIAYKAMGNASYWWIIAQYNNVKDPNTLRSGDNLRIPTFTIERPIRPVGPPPRDRTIKDAILAAPPRYQTALVETEEEAIASNVLYLYNFTVPGCLTGRVHMEVQVSLDPQYSEILMGRSSAINPERFTYYDQSGGYKDWPASGLDGSSNGGAPVIFRVVPTDPLILGGTYYFRARAWVDDNGVLKFGKWVSEAVKI